MSEKRMKFDREFREGLFGSSKRQVSRSRSLRATLG